MRWVREIVSGFVVLALLGGGCGPSGQGASCDDDGDCRSWMQCVAPATGRGTARCMPRPCPEDTCEERCERLVEMRRTVPLGEAPPSLDALRRQVQGCWRACAQERTKRSGGAP